jgi:hypothetical protein
VGGGRVLSEMIGVPMNHRSISSTVVVIAIDLSSPGNAIDSLLFWLNAVRENIQICLEPIHQTNAIDYKHMIAKMQAKWENHEDR